MKKQLCVIGLGRFGATVAKELYQAGHDVLAIDYDEVKIQDMLGQATYAVRADATSEPVLRELGVADMDVAIVALGSENIQASILITVLLKSIGVPFVIARAANELHGEPLERVGADRVIFPELESAQRTAHVGADIAESQHIAIRARPALGAPSKFDQQCRLSRARVRKWNRLVSHQLREICDPNGLVLVYGQPKRSSGGNPGDHSRLSLVELGGRFGRFAAGNRGGDPPGNCTGYRGRRSAYQNAAPAYYW